MKTLLTLLLIALGQITWAQREYLDDKEAIQQRASAELELAMQGPNGNLYKTVVKEQLTGSYLLEISLGDKGDIRSVQVLERTGGDIPSQNRFKQLVHDTRFSSFKTPKGKQYRFTHRFNLDPLQHQ